MPGAGVGLQQIMREKVGGIENISHRKDPLPGSSDYLESLEDGSDDGSPKGGRTPLPGGGMKLTTSRDPPLATTSSS